MRHQIQHASQIWSDESHFYVSSGLLDGDALAVNSERKKVFDDGWKLAFERLDVIASLDEDWDGEGATCPTFELWNSAREWLSSMNSEKVDPPSRIVSATDGAILIEWRHGDSYEEAEISVPYCAEIMLIKPNHPPQHDTATWRRPLRKTGYLTSVA